MKFLTDGRKWWFDLAAQVCLDVGTVSENERQKLGFWPGE
jgi:hypothetical protein